MATVRPFRGISYEPTRISDLAAVTCPPYDVISDDDRRRLYDRHPYNVVRIVSGFSEPDDSAHENRYTRACGFFRSWLWEGVLREDPDPALYVYRQAFTDPQGRMRRVWGLLASIALSDEILAHERTMAGPKEDRLALMEAVPANLSPIYALYREENGQVSAALPEHTTDALVADFVDDQGSRHTAWAVHDEAFHDKVASGLAHSPLLIADGHHRFETAKLYGDRRRTVDGEGPWDHTMALLVDAGAQPVCILPYHRIVTRWGVHDPLPTLREHFDVESLGPLERLDLETVERELWHAGAGDFVCLIARGAYRLHNPGVSPNGFDDDIPAGVLKRLALDPLRVGGAEEALRFTPKAGDARAAVVGGDAVAGFLIPPVDVERVWSLAASMRQMPEKSTYFYPKPRDGIVMRALQPCDQI